MTVLGFRLPARQLLYTSIRLPMRPQSAFPPASTILSLAGKYPIRFSGAMEAGVGVEITGPHIGLPLAANPLSGECWMALLLAIPIQRPPSDPAEIHFAHGV